MNYKKVIIDGFILGVGAHPNSGNITEEEYNTISEILRNIPSAPEGYKYLLQDGTLEWMLLKIPPAPDPTPTAEEALTRYANELTNGNAENIQEATENLIKKLWRNEK